MPSCIIQFKHILFYPFNIPTGHAFHPIICWVLYQSLNSQILLHKPRNLIDEFLFFLHSFITVFYNFRFLTLTTVTENKKTGKRVIQTVNEN